MRSSSASVPTRRHSEESNYSISSSSKKMRQMNRPTSPERSLAQSAFFDKILQNLIKYMHMRDYGYEIDIERQIFEKYLKSRF